MSIFRPIKANAGSWEPDEADTIRLNEEQQDKITALLMGRKVTKVGAEHLVLDNGTVIKAIGRDGGCSCLAGCYDLSVLNSVDNIITRVEFDYAPAGDGDDWDKGADRPNPHPDDPADKWVGYYRIFVYAEDQRINLMQFDGSDGNGYYGTGFEILVRLPDEEVEP